MFWHHLIIVCFPLLESRFHVSRTFCLIHHCILRTVSGTFYSSVNILLTGWMKRNKPLGKIRTGSRRWEGRGKGMFLMKQIEDGMGVALPEEEEGWQESPRKSHLVNTSLWSCLAIFIAAFMMLWKRQLECCFPTAVPILTMGFRTAKPRSPWACSPL